MLRIRLFENYSLAFIYSGLSASAVRCSGVTFFVCFFTFRYHSLDAISSGVLFPHFNGSTADQSGFLS